MSYPLWFWGRVTLNHHCLLLISMACFVKAPKDQWDGFWGRNHNIDSFIIFCENTEHGLAVAGITIGKRDKKEFHEPMRQAPLQDNWYLWSFLSVHHVKFRTPPLSPWMPKPSVPRRHRCKLLCPVSNAGCSQWCAMAAPQSIGSLCGSKCCLLHG